MRIYGTIRKTEIEVDEDSEDFLNQTKWENKSTPRLLPSEQSLIGNSPINGILTPIITI